MRGIVVGVKGSVESDEALDWALAEAASRQVPLTAALAVASDDPEELERRRAVVQDVLDRARERTGSTIEASAEVVHGPAADALLEASADADMLVLGRRDRGRLGRLVLGSVSSRIVEHATVPVTVVRHHDTPGEEDAPHESEGPATVVAGVDTSPPSVAALRHAGEVAARTGAVLEAVFAWQITTLAPLPGSWGWAPPLDDYERFARECLAAAVERSGVDLPEERLRQRVEHGAPARVLLEASRTAERLVVGARGLGGFERLVLGSVSRQALDYASCPVTVVRR
ncbi:universal stress protein [Isoptericola variabilis]|uniref:UspA domain-containing protein n=1 Tax=Isoptericola variabilis (strain 225) TaxID=743718 RepID=F6FU49_ISOV2|nr:universal stress protein [Isoptericola variabilis]AEG43245.1 UspA domain-containing protein [Isoptericola variabilis 225]TWH35180.1 nucleotide-binding universal stress UspA family protein [Isoptericola variabilis J7]